MGLEPGREQNKDPRHAALWVNMKVYHFSFIILPFHPPSSTTTEGPLFIPPLQVPQTWECDSGSQRGRKSLLESLSANSGEGFYTAAQMGVTGTWEVRAWEAKHCIAQRAILQSKELSCLNYPSCPMPCKLRADEHEHCKASVGGEASSPASKAHHHCPQLLGCGTHWELATANPGQHHVNSYQVRSVFHSVNFGTGF